MKKQEYQQMFLEENENWWFWGKRRYVGEILSRYLPKEVSMILDVGCGTGGMTKYLSRFGKVVGLDADLSAVKLAKSRGLDVTQARAEKLPVESNSVDLVVMTDVLYHRHVDEKLALQEVKRVIKPGGWLLVTDCAHSWLYSRHDEIMMAKKRFGKHELRNLISTAGFKIKRASYLYFLTFPLFTFRRLLMRSSLSMKAEIETGKILNFVLRKIIQNEAIILKYFDLPIGSSILVLARK